MSNIFIAKSMIFYPDYYSDNCQSISDQVIIPTHSLNRFIDYYDEDESVFLMKMINTNNDKECIVSIGTPHYYEKDTIYAPQWMLDIIGCTGNCDTPIKLIKLDEEIPLATGIIIKPLDALAFKVDLVECFQKVLENLHTLQEGSTIPVTIPELGNYEYLAYIEKVEPHKISRTHTDDISVDFLRDFEEAEPTAQMVDTNNIPSNNTIPIIPYNEVVEPSLSATIASIPQQISEAERRRKVRESWANRFATPSSATPSSERTSSTQ